MNKLLKARSEGFSDGDCFTLRVRESRLPGTERLFYAFDIRSTLF